MNKKGYMLYELIIAFVLTTIIAIFLLSSSFKLSDKNEDLIMSSKMSIIQENFTSRFYDDASTSEYIYYTGDMSTGDNEYCSFDIDGKLVTFGTRRETTSDGNNKYYIYYNGYEEQLPDGIVLKSPSIKCDTTYKRNNLGIFDYEQSTLHQIEEGKKNSAISIYVGITDSFTEKDYDINIMYIYNNLDENLKYNEE